MQNETVLNRMMKELASAKEKAHNNLDFLQHIEHIKLLCELFLEEEGEVPNEQAPAFTEQEMKAMLGPNNSITREKKGSSDLDHDGANGDSIFDF